MKSSKATLENQLAAFRQKFQKEHTAAAKVVFPDLLQFLVALATEGERSAVVLGAERINVALEALFKAFLRPSQNKSDNLFSSEGALASFSRKIDMAYRLGLIDLRFRQALDLIRKLRNDFAHATKVEPLQEQRHADKVKALFRLVVSGNGNQETLEGFQLAFQAGGHTGEEAQIYLSCVMLLLMKLELVRHHLKPPDIDLPAKLNYQERE